MLYLLFIFLLIAGCSGDDPVSPYETGLHNASNIDMCIPHIPVSDSSLAGGFDMRVRMSPEFSDRWNRDWNPILIRVMEKWESVIVSRPKSLYPISGEKLPPPMDFASFTDPDSVYFGGYELEILLVFDPSLGGFAAGSSVPFEYLYEEGYMPMSFMLVGNNFWDTFENPGVVNTAMERVFLHEFGHAIGFTGASKESSSLHTEVRGRLGHSCGWAGLNAVSLFNSILDTNVSMVPMEQDCSHWDPKDGDFKKIQDVMFPDYQTITNNISPITLGYFQDLGFGVNYENADEPLKENWGIRPAGKRTGRSIILSCGAVLEL